eukprot:3175662-Pleurochrysis_carterae.AAC.1
MEQLDDRESALGLPSSCAALVDHPSPIQTPGFRGYFAGVRPVSAEIIQRYPHLTTEQAVALSDAESTVDTLRTRFADNLNVNRGVRRALDADLACAEPPSAPPSPPEVQPSAPSSNLQHPRATASTPRSALFALSVLLN